MEPSKQTTSSDLIRTRSLVDTVTERLREDIFDGSIQPGERIRTVDLEQRFGVSHIPIREAIRRLETEGLVLTSPRRSTVAAGVTLDDLADLYELRKIIETGVARRSVPVMRDSHRRDIRVALAAFEKAALHPEAPEFWRAHHEFHWSILAPGGSTWTRRVLDQLWHRADRYVRLFVFAFGQMDEPRREHQLMVDACEEGNADVLVNLIESHLARTVETVREGYLARRRDSNGVTEKPQDSGV